MKQTLLARCVVGAVVLLALAALYLPASGVDFLEGAEASSAAGYDSGSSPIALLVSFGIFALYVWVMRLPVDPMRRSVSAGMWRRFLAFYVDFMFGMLMVAPWAGLIAVAVEAIHTGTFAWSIHRDEATSADFMLSFGLVLPAMAALLMYFAWPQHRGNPSPGALLFGIWLKCDKPLSLSSAAGRVVLGLLALSAGLITVPMALADPEKRMWQDKSFRTRVVRWID